ncbi:K02A2.6-like [Cordylochernes scorpioides]|uniref:RNA-directed DNA polymerase n=1 Tax=Cordylochernes scorpioides TaxID=51811 RepID=A0ABY6LFU5_9ARAC|nr:K02A2.6-like [Cordylochernes scorpioides]
MRDFFQCDASKHGLGATLLQESQPIIFASRSLSKTEQNYAQIEKECLAIVFACERFHQYILGKCQVIVQTDHKPLLSIFKKSILKAPQRLQRMLLRLQRYNLELEHVQGSQMHLADIFSRACIKDVRNENLKYDVYPIDIIYKEIATVNVMETLSVCSDTVLRIREETSSDPILCEVKKLILNGWPPNKNQTSMLTREYWNFREELTVQDGIILKNDRMVIPNKSRKEMIIKTHQGHIGINSSMRRARDNIFWPGMNAQIGQEIENCSICLSNSQNQVREPMKSHKIPNYPWERISLDIFEIFKQNYLIIVDHYSDFFEVECLENTTSEYIIECCKRQFSIYGIPQIIVSDNGRQFTSTEFQKFSKEWQFQHSTSSPLHSQGNGKAEAAVKIAKNLLKKSKQENNIDSSPVQRIMSRRTRAILPIHPNLLKPSIPENIPDKISIKRQQAKYYYDRKSKNLPDLDIGQEVYVRTPNTTPSWSKANITNEHNTRSYDVNIHGRTYRRNRTWIKPQQASANQKSTNNQEEGRKESIDQEQTVSNCLPSTSSAGGDNIVKRTRIETTECRIQSKSDSPTVSEPENAASETRTRSGRLVKKPSRFKDYWKVLHLSDYLQDEALTYYFESRCHIEDWNKLKGNLITRFQKTKLTPLVEMMKIIQEENETVTQFYHRKMQLINSVELNLTSIIELSNEGIKKKFKPYLATIDSVQPSEWLLMATKIEKKQFTPVKFNLNYSQTKKFQPFPRTAAATHHQQETHKPINLPPYPCKICSTNQIPNQMHFHRDCPLKKNTPPKPINPGELGIVDGRESDSKGQTETDPSKENLLKDEKPDIAPGSSQVEPNVAALVTVLNNQQQLLNKLEELHLATGQEGMAKMEVERFNGNNVDPLIWIQNYEIICQNNNGKSSQTEVNGMRALLEDTALLCIFASECIVLELEADNRRIEVTAVIIEEMPFEILLGKPTMKIFKIQWDFHSDNIKCLALNANEYAFTINDVQENFPSLCGFFRIRVPKFEVDFLLKPDCNVIRSKPYSTSEYKRKWISNKIKEMLDRGIIVPSTSEFASPCVLVQKKDSSFRLCQDYRRLNQETHLDPFSSIDRIIDRFGGCHYFTKIDSRDGFWQIGLTIESRKFSAVVTQEALSYKILTRLAKFDMTINLGKCQFCVPQVELLGRMINGDFKHMKDQVIEKVKNMRRPYNLKSLQCFTGLTGHFRPYIPNYAMIIRPLDALKRKDSIFTWTEECEESYLKLLTLITSNPILRIPDGSLQYELTTDASYYGTGAVLYQRDITEKKSRQLRVINYYSYMFTRAEQNCSVTEKECLAVLKAVEHFRAYLECKSFTVHTDHRALTQLPSCGNLRDRLARWQLFLISFEMNINHRSGKELQDADALSRLAIDSPTDPNESILWTNHRSIDLKLGDNKKYLVPPEDRDSILLLYHDDPLSASFPVCQQVKFKYKYRSNHMSLPPQSQEPFHTVHLDYAEAPTKGDARLTFLIVIDEATRLAQAKAIKQDGKDRYAQLTFRLKQPELTVYTLRPKYITIEVFGYFGGYIGMWLGFALVEVNDFLDLYTFIQEYRAVKSSN